MKKMKTICAWCEKDLGEKDVPDNTPPGLNHGICTDCLKNFGGEQKSPKEPPRDSGKIH